MAAGELTWVGIEPSGDRDGRIALYLTQNPSRSCCRRLSFAHAGRAIGARAILAARPRAARRSVLPGVARSRGRRLSRRDQRRALAARRGRDWSAMIRCTRLRNLRRSKQEREGRIKLDGQPGSPDFLKRFRARSSGIGSSEGRWSLLSSRLEPGVSATVWSANIAQQLLVRYGIVMRDVARLGADARAAIRFVYPAFKQMEESGWIRRGMFVGGLGAAQFAMTAAVDMLRSLRKTMTALRRRRSCLPRLIPRTPSARSCPGRATAKNRRRRTACRARPAQAWCSSRERSRASCAAAIPRCASSCRKKSRIAVAMRARLLLRSRPARTRCRQGRQGLLIGEINGAPAREPSAREISSRKQGLSIPRSATRCAARTRRAR